MRVKVNWLGIILNGVILGHIGSIKNCCDPRFFSIQHESAMYNFVKKNKSLESHSAIEVLNSRHVM
jgi:hypothetical protein